MRKSRFSEEQIIAILKEHQAGIALADIFRKHGTRAFSHLSESIGIPKSALRHKLIKSIPFSGEQ